MEFAKHSDWQNTPMPEQHASFSLERTFSLEQMRRLQNGLVPEQMEDKWFIYFDDNTLYFHRSWTGFCIYAMHFVERDGQFAITSVDVSRDPEQYKSTDIVEDTSMLNTLIDILLNRRR